MPGCSSGEATPPCRWAETEVLSPTSPVLRVPERDSAALPQQSLFNTSPERGWWLLGSWVVCGWQEAFPGQETGGTAQQGTRRAPNQTRCSSEGPEPSLCEVHRFMTQAGQSGQMARQRGSGQVRTPEGQAHPQRGDAGQCRRGPAHSALCAPAIHLPDAFLRRQPSFPVFGQLICSSTLDIT